MNMFDKVSAGWGGLSQKGRAVIVVVAIVAAAVLVGMAMTLRIDLLPYIEAFK